MPTEWKREKSVTDEHRDKDEQVLTEFDISNPGLEIALFECEMAGLVETEALNEAMRLDRYD